jgi:hypothetical protein
LSSGEADESFAALTVVITVSFAKSKLSVGGEALANKVRHTSVNGGGRGDGGGNECDGESLHVYIKL